MLIQRVERELYLYCSLPIYALLYIHLRPCPPCNPHTAGISALFVGGSSRFFSGLVGDFLPPTHTLVIFVVTYGSN